MFKFSGYECKGGNDDKPKETEKPKSPHLSKLFSICEVRPHLYIAGYGAISEQKFRELGIKYAIDCTNLPKPVVIPNTE